MSCLKKTFWSLNSFTLLAMRWGLKPTAVLQRRSNISFGSPVFPSKLWLLDAVYNDDKFKPLKGALSEGASCLPPKKTTTTKTKNKQTNKQTNKTTENMHQKNPFTGFYWNFLVFLSILFYVTEVHFCFEYEPLRAQIYWFALYQ